MNEFQSKCNFFLLENAFETPIWNSHLNLLTGRYGCNFASVISEDTLRNKVHEHLWNGSQMNAQNTFDDKSTLAQVLACCLTTPCHHLSQCWPTSVSPYGVTRPQWVKAYIQRTTWKLCYTQYIKFVCVCNYSVSTNLMQITPNTTRNQRCRLHQGPILLN